MASVNYMVLGKRNPSNIYCRFLHTRGIDIKIKINVFVNPKNWDSKYQKIKNVSAVKNRNEINRKLSQLKIEIIDNFNISFLEGEVIDKEWLQNIFNDFFKRPEDVKSKVNLNHTIYYIEFGRWWLEHKSTKWLTPTNTSMSKREVSKYQSFLCLIDKFSRKSKIKLSKSGNEFITNFILWLKENAVDRGAMPSRRRLVARSSLEMSSVVEVETVKSTFGCAGHLVPLSDWMKTCRLGVSFFRGSVSLA